jgi:predicted PurR-regulated permease PerM
VAAVILAVTALGFTAHALKTILVPFLLALFLMQVVDGLETPLRRRLRLPAPAALGAAIIVVLAVFGLSVWIITRNAAGLVAESGGYAARLTAILQMIADKVGLHAAPTLASLLKMINPAQYAPEVARTAEHLLQDAVFVLIYLAFMLASRASFGAKVAAIFREGAQAEASAVARRIQAGVESYVFIQTVVGLIIAAASFVAIWLLGVGHALFWAFIIFLANYIPVVGVAVSVALPPLFGLVTLDDMWRPVLLFAALEAIHFVVSHGIQPRLQGTSLNIDPIVVLLSLGFWGALFGIAGAFLSTPLTVAVMAVCTELGGARWIAILLSADGRPDLGAPAGSSRGS